MFLAAFYVVTRIDDIVADPDYSYLVPPVVAGTGEAEEENCIKLSCLRLFLAAFYVVTGLREFKQPRFQLSGSLELGKQRREITSN